MGEFASCFNRLAAPKEQPPPESLRQMDRAGLTVWKVSCLRRAAEGAKLSGAATDGGAGEAALTPTPNVAEPAHDRF